MPVWSGLGVVKIYDVSRCGKLPRHILLSDFLTYLGAFFLVDLIVGSILPSIISLPFSAKNFGIGVFLGEIFNVTVLSTLAAQLTIDHQHRGGEWTSCYPWIVGACLFVLLTLSSKTNRLVVRTFADQSWENSWSLDLRFWLYPSSLTLPAIILFLKLPNLNLPFIYKAFTHVFDWLFQVPIIGGAIKWVSVIYAVSVVLGTVIAKFAALKAGKQMPTEN